MVGRFTNDELKMTIPYYELFRTTQNLSRRTEETHDKVRIAGSAISRIQSEALATRLDSDS
jgi:hypothetical protein